MDFTLFTSTQVPGIEGSGSHFNQLQGLGFGMQVAVDISFSSLLLSQQPSPGCSLQLLSAGVGFAGGVQMGK